MACDVPRPECLHDHIKGHLRSPRLSDAGNGYRALCPAHDDREPSLGIFIGDNGRIHCKCFKGCDPLAVRRGLINDGIDPGCLSLPPKVQKEALDEVREILVMPCREDTLVRLMALARVDGIRKRPRGGVLVGLARLVGIGRSQAFHYGDRWDAWATSDTKRRYEAEKTESSTRTSARRGGAHRKSGNPDSVRKPGPSKVRKPGLGDEAADMPIKPAA